MVKLNTIQNTIPDFIYQTLCMEKKKHCLMLNKCAKYFSFIFKVL